MQRLVASRLGEIFRVGVDVHIHFVNVKVGSALWDLLVFKLMCDQIKIAQDLGPALTAQGRNYFVLR